MVSESRNHDTETSNEEDRAENHAAPCLRRTILTFHTYVPQSTHPLLVEFAASRVHRFSSKASQCEEGWWLGEWASGARGQGTEGDGMSHRGDGDGTRGRASTCRVLHCQSTSCRNTDMSGQVVHCPRHVTIMSCSVQLWGCLVMADTVTSCQVMLCPVKSSHVWSCEVKLCRATSYHVMPRQLITDDVMSCHDVSCQVMSRGMKGQVLSPMIMSSVGHQLQQKS